MPSEGTAFADRLAYARWLYVLRTGDYPTNRALARGGGVSEAWVSKWQDSQAAPDGRAVARDLSAYLDVPERWLFDGEGPAPDPELWVRWIERRGQPAMPTPPAAQVKRASRGGIPATEPAKKRKRGS